MKERLSKAAGGQRLSGDDAAVCVTHATKPSAELRSLHDMPSPPTHVAVSDIKD